MVQSFEDDLLYFRAVDSGGQPPLAFSDLHMPNEAI